MHKMQRMCLTVAAGVVPFLLVSCATMAAKTPAKPYIKSASWDGVTRDKVYLTTLQALHLSGYELHPQLTTKESGLIVTQETRFYPFNGFRLVEAGYRLNILVLENGPQTSINIQVKARWWKNDSGAWGFSYKEVKNLVANRVSDDLDELMSSLDGMLREPSVKTTAMISWR